MLIIIGRVFFMKKANVLTFVINLLIVTITSLHTLLFIIKLDTNVFTSVIVYRPVGARGAGGAIALPDFVRSVNPISTRGQIRPTT